LDVFEEVTSSRHFRFFSEPSASDSAKGGDKVESLPSREPSAPSPSYFSKVSGALESVGAISAAIVPSSGRGEIVKPEIGDPTKIVSTEHHEYIVRKGRKIKHTFGLQITYMWQRMSGVEGSS
jgi:hypothetical protein